MRIPLFPRVGPLLPHPPSAEKKDEEHPPTAAGKPDRRGFGRASHSQDDEDRSASRPPLPFASDLASPAHQADRARRWLWCGDPLLSSHGRPLMTLDDRVACMWQQVVQVRRNSLRRPSVPVTIDLGLVEARLGAAAPSTAPNNDGSWSGRFKP